MRLVGCANLRGTVRGRKWRGNKDERSSSTVAVDKQHDGRFSRSISPRSMHVARTRLARLDPIRVSWCHGHFSLAIDLIGSKRLKGEARAVEEARCSSAPPRQRAALRAIGPSPQRPPRRRTPAARMLSAVRQPETARRGQRDALAACEKHRCRAHLLGGDEVRRVEGAVSPSWPRDACCAVSRRLKSWSRSDGTLLCC